ncbi:hypothetical protein AMAG_16170 [Allomyces macrogynus ATCC 38327]|uniref:Uncharacterized protein n=1 Tax=Allomyces macrogynus (strain ATCC 38327) TaxID=578462 RepID=A0A0L0T9X3_ALLM3|nr:hypothetical protein AMAG_16170 [Allomyces macrogynus ATCC 38327]|eukprot:KNE71608.1 hypothetical protein AMAG_16170 [Allomyces macrogynus ATCC 38327]
MRDQLAVLPCDDPADRHRSSCGAGKHSTATKLATSCHQLIPAKMPPSLTAKMPPSLPSPTGATAAPPRPRPHRITTVRDLLERILGHLPLQAKSRFIAAFPATLPPLPSLLDSPFTFPTGYPLVVEPVPRARDLPTILSTAFRAPGWHTAELDLTGTLITRGITLAQIAAAVPRLQVLKCTLAKPHLVALDVREIGECRALPPPPPPPPPRAGEKVDADYDTSVLVDMPRRDPMWPGLRRCVVAIGKSGTAAWSGSMLLPGLAMAVERMREYPADKWRFFVDAWHDVMNPATEISTSEGWETCLDARACGGALVHGADPRRGARCAACCELGYRAAGWA